MESCSACSLAKNLPGTAEQHIPQADKRRGWEDAGAALPHLAGEVSALEMKCCDPPVSQEEGAPDLPVPLHKIMMEVTSLGLGKQPRPVAIEAGESCNNLLNQGREKSVLMSGFGL